MLNASDYFFFYGHGNNDKGVFSQWFPLEFVATKEDLGYLLTAENKDLISNLPEKIEFANAEQYMMFAKGIYFNDSETVAIILQTPDPKQVKALGRRVKNFNEYKWIEIRESVGIKGNLLKFSQTEWAKTRLLETGSKTIVEASPSDKIWGIGFKHDNAMRNFNKWGLNILGKSLVEVRERIKKQEESTSQA